MHIAMPDEHIFMDFNIDSAARSLLWSLFINLSGLHVGKFLV